MSMLKDENAENLGNQIAFALSPIAIKACVDLLKGVRDNTCVRSIMREWLARCDGQGGYSEPRL